MNSRLLVTVYLVLALSAGQVWAQSASYHLERLQIQGRAFLETFGPATQVSSETGATLSSRLQQATDNSVWAHQMVIDDVQKVVDTGREWSEQLKDPTPDELRTARTTLESLTRRLRVSTAAVSVSAESQTALNFLFLELEESANVLELQRAQLLAQEASKRRSRVQIGLGLGYGYGYGDWGYPWGVGRYYPYGYGFGPGPYYPGFPYRPAGCPW